MGHLTEFYYLTHEKLLMLWKGREAARLSAAKPHIWEEE